MSVTVSLSNVLVLMVICAFSYHLTCASEQAAMKNTITNARNRMPIFFQIPGTVATNTSTTDAKIQAIERPSASVDEGCYRLMKQVP